MKKLAARDYEDLLQVVRPSLSFKHSTSFRDGHTEHDTCSRGSTS